MRHRSLMYCRRRNTNNCLQLQLQLQSLAVTFKCCLKRKERKDYLYSAFIAQVVLSKRSGMDHTVLITNSTMPLDPNLGKPFIGYIES